MFRVIHCCQATVTDDNGLSVKKWGGRSYERKKRVDTEKTKIQYSSVVSRTLKAMNAQSGIAMLVTRLRIGVCVVHCLCCTALI